MYSETSDNELDRHTAHRGRVVSQAICNAAAASHRAVGVPVLRAVARRVVVALER